MLTDSRALSAVGILFILVIFVTMVYGPIAALLVELFPTRIRYSGMSLPYHIGNGWFGGFLPPTAFAIVAASGNIFSGLWYPIIIGARHLRDRSPAPAGDQGPRHPEVIIAPIGDLGPRPFEAGGFFIVPPPPPPPPPQENAREISLAGSLGGGPRFPR